MLMLIKNFNFNLNSQVILHLKKNKKHSMLYKPILKEVSVTCLSQFLKKFSDQICLKYLQPDNSFDSREQMNKTPTN